MTIALFCYGTLHVYAWVEAVLESGRSAWIYVGPPLVDGAARTGI
jgi:hypothetical protein